MKWLFLLLLIINIGIFAWGYQHEQVKRQTTVEAGTDVGDMRLISELEEDEKREIADDGAEVVIAKAEQAVAEHITAQEEGDVQTATIEAVEDEDAAVTEKVVEDKKSQPEDTAKAESVSEPKEEKVKKVEEAEGQQEVASKDDAPKQKEKKQVRGENGAVRRCGIIGPLKDRQVAKDVVEDLSGSEIEAKLERKIEKEQIGYWVVIPPVEDGSQAQAKIDELAQVGLKDIWHFRGGGMKNAISLGMFAKKENAENFSKEVLKKGFKTEMQPRYLNRTKYLVKFSIAKSKTVTENLWQDVERKYSKMQFSRQPCE